jgi:hypothetical protein
VRSGPGRVRQTGVALAIVVWFIAGMSLLVAGIVSHARVDTRMAQLHVAGARAAAAGDGAIQLMMASLVTGRLEAPSPGDLTRAGFRMGELRVEVTLVPVNGLLDINVAPPLLLELLFIRVGGMDPAAAKTVADNVIKWRKPARQGQRALKPRRFTVIEDLLRVEGVNRGLFDQVRDYLVVVEGSRGGTNWSAAPENLMGVLREADPRKAAAIERQRVRSGASDEGNQVPVISGGAYRLDAVVRYGDELWLRRRWVRMEPAVGSILPWRVSRTEAPRVVGKAI